ncbi:MAG: 3-methyl-2-oxobutanoate dehydrogenase subunit beta, partial [Dehalococcoidia bacterium]|nr:3-methyl-2-oxobutanoate dehydrogenase subunit beta [Dehalococcoidia bacterium]
VQRGGPGMGHIRQAQVDYLSVTRGGGNGGYRNIVLAPFSVQETHDFVQLAFYLGDKYRNPVIVLTDALIGQLAESLEVKVLDFGPLPEKDWAIVGKDRRKDGLARVLMCSNGNFDYIGFLEGLDKKCRAWQQEVRYENYFADDAEVIIVAYGYCGRVAKETVDWARQEGYKTGLIRPITLHPFPYDILRQKAEEGKKFLVVEDSMGQMLVDVEIAVQGKAPISFVGASFRHQRDDGGKIFPDKVFGELKKLF